MAHDDRREKLKANLIAGMSKGEAARAAGYSETFARVNVYTVTKTPEFQAELEQARAASESPSPITRQPASNTLLSVSQRGNPSSPDSEQLNPDDELTVKEQLFRNYYLGEARYNGTLAARMAGYSGDDNTLGQTAHQLLKKPKIKASVQQMLSNSKMRAEEVLELLSKQARGSIADVLDDSGSFDLNVAKQRGTDGLLRKVKIRRRVERDRDGSETEFIDHDVEIHNSQKALELMGDHYGVLGDTSPDSLPHDAIGHRDLIVILQSCLRHAGIVNDAPIPECIDVTLEPREMAPPEPEPVAVFPPANEKPGANLPAFLFPHPFNDCPR